MKNWASALVFFFHIIQSDMEQWSGADVAAELDQNLNVQYLNEQFPRTRELRATVLTI